MNYKKSAFTLAEVLITLTIIGVIATLTIVPLISDDKIEKMIAEAKLPKFYSTMQQAMKMERARLLQNPKWWAPSANCGKPTRAECAEDYWNKHFAPYIKAKVTKRDPDNVHFFVRFDDGTGFNGYINDSNNFHFFYCLNYKDCESESYDGRTTFLFTLVGYGTHKGKFITSSEPYLNMSREELLTACKESNWAESTSGGKETDPNKNIHRHACTALIERDGWKIKDDYPWDTDF